MSPAVWIIIGLGFCAALFCLLMAICAVAKDADEALTARDETDVEWTGRPVAHMCEYRHRRDARNGLGRAS